MHVKTSPPRGKVNEGGLIVRIACAVDAIGHDRFYDRLLDLIGAVVPHDLAALVRYSRSARPDLIIPRSEPSDVIATYIDFFYALDPLFHHWREVGQEGVFRLRSLASGLWRSRYAREFLGPAAIHDEIAVFLPPIGDAAPTLILDRAKGSFTELEAERVRRLFPVLAALHKRHLRTLVSTETDSEGSPIGGERPLRFVDRLGNPIFTTKAWRVVFEAGDAGLQGILDALDGRGPCRFNLPRQRVLRRIRLPADFGPAPGGNCDEIRLAISELDPNNRWRMPETIAARLTAREQDVVALTLKGYPVAEIARQLGLSRGTVKNYRYRIYAKLDITTERELFVEYTQAFTSAVG